MSKEEILSSLEVLPINKDSSNLIFIDKSALSMEDAYSAAQMLASKQGVNFGAIVMVHGNPNEVVKLISAKDLPTKTK